MTGEKIGHYELLEKLGEGGMGVVYKARDLLLNRSAALKLLPPDGNVSEEQRRRLVEEAQAASALNHPNIVTVYEVGQAGNRDYIAMELVSGQTLESLIERKGLALPEALEYAVQIADALAAAHAAGIVHRDLKPGNIMVSASRRVKVLDFGLAKLTTPMAKSESDLTRTLVAASPKTAEGVIAGTVSYMSPEQAEGKPVDARSDIFAFGDVLYEMLTGQRAFAGESPISTLAGILHVEPRNIAQYGKGVPRELERLVRRCLGKIPDKRWQSMADVRMALEDVQQDLASGPVTAVEPLRAKRFSYWLPIAAATLIAAMILGGWAWLARSPAPSLEQYSIRRLTSDNGSNVSSAISPDGKLVAYASDRSGEGNVDIWVQQVAGGDPVRLTHDLGQCTGPAFSADGSKIVFHSQSEGGGIYLISALGGTPRKVAVGEVPQFSPDGTLISYLNLSNSKAAANKSIMLAPVTGGTPRELPTRHSGVGRPIWSPDGKGLLYLGIGSGEDDRDWFFIRADGSGEKKTGAIAKLKEAGWGLLQPQGWAGNDVLFFAGVDYGSINIYRLPFDMKALRVTGAPVPITVAPGFNFSPSASQDGAKVVFASGVNVTSNLWQASIDSASGKASGELRRLTDGLDNRVAPFPSLDGSQIAYVALSAGPSEARVRNVRTGNEVRLAEASAATSPVFSEDASQVAYYVHEGDKFAIYAISARGGVARQLCANCGRPMQWFANGTKLLYDSAGPRRSDSAALNVSNGQSKVILQDRGYPLNSPHISPDGRALCFVEVMDGRARRIYVAPFQGEQPIDAKDWTLLVNGSDLERQPSWSPNGKLIYFLSERDGYRCVWAQRIDPSTKRSVGEPFAARHFHQARYNLSDFGDTAQIGLSFAGDQMFFSMREIESNIWIAERQNNQAK